MRFGLWYWLADLALLLLIYGLNFFAWRYFWYWRFSHYGFDKLMHFLAGLAIGMTVAGVWYWWQQKHGRILRKRDLLAWIGLFVLAIGGGWEILERGARHNEAFRWIKPFADLSSGWFDSTTDFISDALGAVLGVFSFKLWNQTKN
jgi:hypothetical protein